MNPSVRFADTSPFRGGMGVMQAPLKGELSPQATEGFGWAVQAEPARTCCRRSGSADCH